MRPRSRGCCRFRKTISEIDTSRRPPCDILRSSIRRLLPGIYPPASPRATREFNVFSKISRRGWFRRRLTVQLESVNEQRARSLSTRRKRKKQSPRVSRSSRSAFVSLFLYPTDSLVGSAGCAMGIEGNNDNERYTGAFASRSRGTVHRRHYTR